jgi:heterodisulfide reductase subunit B
MNDANAVSGIDTYVMIRVMTTIVHNHISVQLCSVENWSECSSLWAARVCDSVNPYHMTAVPNWAPAVGVNCRCSSSNNLLWIL